MYLQIKYINISNRIFVFTLGHAKGLGFDGGRGTQGVNISFFKHGHMAYQNNEDGE